MVLVAEIAGGAAGGAAVLALALALLAVRAHRTTGSKRSLYLAWAFGVSFVQALATAVLLLGSSRVEPAWLAVPLAHAGTMVLMYLALLRV